MENSSRKKVFVSYRRKSWGFTHRLVDSLSKRLEADIFVDIDDVDQADFETAIFSHLRTSHAMALIVTDLTFATERIYREDDWVRKEISEALRLNLPIVMVSVDGVLPPIDLPEEIKQVSRSQAINFYPDYFEAAVERLSEFITKIAHIPTLPAPSSARTVATVVAPLDALLPTPTPVPVPATQATLNEAIRLLDAEDVGSLDKAIFLLEALRQTGFKSKAIKVEVLLEQAHRERAAAAHQREAFDMLNEIQMLASSRRTLPHAREAFSQFQRKFPDIAVAPALLAKLRPPKVDTDTTVPVVVSIPKLGETRTDAFGVPQVYVPVGYFSMGSNIRRDKDSQADEQPIHHVPITRWFWLDTCLVTNEDYGRFIQDKGYQRQDYWSPSGWKWLKYNHITGPKEYAGFDDARQPRVGISWYEADAYAQWRGGRLPTEAEWEYAARGHAAAIFPWGDAYDPARCNAENRFRKTTPVDAYLKAADGGRSWCGAVDMAGNVWEWCADWYSVDYYRASAAYDPTGPMSGTSRVMRGGSWRDGRMQCRAAYRNRNNPIDRNNWTGVRVVSPPSVIAAL
jgi:iron(II)-dependent oxidoreductase